MAIEYSKDFALLLERLRFERGLSQEDFTDGIISNRQYQRYIKGTSLMPFYLLNDFAKKLGIDKDILIYEFENWRAIENLKINNFFIAVSHNDVIKVNSLSKELDPKFIIDPQNLLLYNLSINHFDLYSKKLSTPAFIKNLYDLIDYPKVLDKVALTFNEALVLTTLLTYVKDEESTLISNKLKSFIQNPKLIWTTSSINTFSVIFFSLTKYHGKNQMYNEAIKYADLGIKYCLTYESTVTLDKFYYFKALCHYRLNEIAHYEANLLLIYTTLKTTGENIDSSHLVKVIEKDFSINFKEFIRSYIKNNI